MSRGHPASGVSATGADTYADVPLSPLAAGHRVFNNIIAYVATKAATISLDLGAHDHFPVQVTGAGIPPVKITGLSDFTHVYGKNETGGQNYAGLTVIVW